jgi:hypothetical protein
MNDAQRVSDNIDGLDWSQNKVKNSVNTKSGNDEQGHCQHLIEQKCAICSPECEPSRPHLNLGANGIALCYATTECANAEVG